MTGTLNATGSHAATEAGAAHGATVVVAHAGTDSSSVVGKGTAFALVHNNHGVVLLSQGAVQHAAQKEVERHSLLFLAAAHLDVAEV